MTHQLPCSFYFDIYVKVLYLFLCVSSEHLLPMKNMLKQIKAILVVYFSSSYKDLDIKLKNWFKISELMYFCDFHDVMYAWDGQIHNFSKDNKYVEVLVIWHASALDCIGQGKVVKCIHVFNNAYIHYEKCHIDIYKKYFWNYSIKISSVNRDKLVVEEYIKITVEFILTLSQ